MLVVDIGGRGAMLGSLCYGSALPSLGLSWLL